MATAEQRARARADLAEGKKIVLQTTKLNPKKRAQRDQDCADRTRTLAQFLRQNRVSRRFEVRDYHFGTETFIYLRIEKSVKGNRMSFTHMLALDFLKSTVTVHPDCSGYVTEGSSGVTVCKTMDHLMGTIRGLK